MMVMVNGHDDNYGCECDDGNDYEDCQFLKPTPIFSSS